MEQSNKRIARNTVFLYGRLIFVLLVSLYTVRIVLNALGIDDYGVYNVVGGFVAMFGFLNTTLANATQRFYNFEIGKNGHEASNKVYNVATRTQTIMALAVVVLSELVGVWYLNSQMEIPPGRIWVANWLLQFSIIALFFTIIQVPFSAATMAYERMDFYAIVGVIDVVLKLTIAMFIQLYSGDKLMIYGILLMLISVIDFLLYYGYIKRHFSWLKVEIKSYSKKLLKEILLFSGWNSICTFAFMLRNQGLNLLFNYFFGVAINAANGIALQISSALQQFSGNLIVAFRPQLVDSYARNDFDRTRQMLYMMTKISFALIYVMSIPIILNIDTVLRLWLGSKIPQYTADFAILTIIAMLINCFHTAIVAVMGATGKIKRFSLINSIIVCSIIPLSWIMFYLGFDAIYGYIVSLVIFVVNLIVSLHILKKHFPYKYLDYVKSVILRCVLFSIALPVIPAIIIDHINSNLWDLILSTVATLILSFILLFMIILNKSEQLIALNIIKTKLLKKR